MKELRTNHYITSIIYTGNPESQIISFIARRALRLQNLKEYLARPPDPNPSSMKKTSTFADGGLNRTSSQKPEGAAPKIDLPLTSPGRTQPKPDIPPPIKPTTPPTETKRQSSTRPGTIETQADAWERAEMAKIKEKYEKLNETILSWEERKKKKAKRKLDKAEEQQSGVKAFQKFHRDMELIDQIAGGARAQAHEKRRNEEFKAKEKANIIRTTGKVPTTIT